MGEEVRVSISQINKFSRCSWRWWYEYGPLKVKTGGGAARWLGSAVHLALEEYMKNGVHSDAATIAHLMKEDKNFEGWGEQKLLKVAQKAVRIAKPVDKLPPVGSQDLERAVKTPCGEATMVGFVDMSSREGSLGYVGDHKTTSNLSWAKSQQEVQSDPQLLSYAWALFHKDPPEEVKVELLYRTTKGFVHTLNVTAVVPWPKIKEMWLELEAMAAVLVEHKFDKTPQRLTPNHGACGDFRGCDHVERCPHSPQNRNKATMASLFEDNKKTPHAAPPKTKTLTPVVKSVISNPPFGAQTETTKGKIQMTEKNDFRKALGLSRFLSPDAPEEVEQTPALKKAVAARVAQAPEHKAAIETAMGLEVSVTPPPLNAALMRSDLEALSKRILQHGQNAVEARDNAEEEVLAGWGKNLTPKRWGYMLEVAGLVTFEGVLVDPTKHKENPDTGEAVEPQPAKVEPQPAHRVAGVLPPVAPFGYTSTPPVAVVGEVENANKNPATFAADLLVLVDCHFEKAPQGALTLSEFAAPYVRTVEQASGVPYYELIEYGAGAKQVAGQMVAAFFKTPPHGVLLVDTTDPLAGRCLAVLRQAGALIIRGR